MVCPQGDEARIDKLNGTVELLLSNRLLICTTSPHGVLKSLSGMPSMVGIDVLVMGWYVSMQGKYPDTARAQSLDRK